MTQPALHRRDFLTASIAAATLGGLTTFGAPRVSAIEPFTRTGTPKFKYSLAAYSYRDYFSGKLQPKLSLENFIVDCAKMQLEGTELTSYYFPSETTGEYLRRIKRLCFDLGLDISGTAIGNNFCIPAGEKRDRQLATVRRWIDNAEILGAPVIRIFSGSAAEGQSPEEAQKIAIEGIEECCHYAGEHGVVLALENHGGLTTHADDLLSLVKRVNSPWFAVNLDTGNFHSDDIYGDLAKLAPYAANVQVKVMVAGPDGKKVPSDFPRLAEMMVAAKYRGYIVLEYEEADDPRTACPKYASELRKAFEAATL